MSAPRWRKPTALPSTYRKRKRSLSPDITWSIPAGVSPSSSCLNMRTCCWHAFLVSAVFLGGGWPAQFLEPYIGHLFATLLAVGIMMTKVFLFLFFYYLAARHVTAISLRPNDELLLESALTAGAAQSCSSHRTETDHLRLGHIWERRRYEFSVRFAVADSEGA